jgi:hypothetical protein
VITTVPAAAVHQVGASELRGLLGQVEQAAGTRLLLVAAAPAWDGPPVLDSDLGPVRVVLGTSPLAVRIAMADHPNEFLAVLTPLTARELGEEVTARAWRHSVRRPSPWDAVTSLFKVTQIDPSLRDEAWMVDLLVRLAPPGGYRQPDSRLLDRGTAWRALYQHGLALPVAEPIPAQLLAWAATTAAHDAVERLDAAARANVAAKLAVDVGPAAELLVELAAAGQGSNVVALGLVIDALWPAPDPAARIRLEERHLGRRSLTGPAADDWARTARDMLRSGELSSQRAAVLTRAQAILDDIDPAGSADSSVLPTGFTRRLERLAEALEAAVVTPGAATLRDAETTLATVRDHADAARAGSRLAAADAAFRLVRRWTVAGADDPAPVAGDLTTLTRTYLDEGAWVDAARHRIAQGETVASLAAVYRRLLERVDEERRQRDRTYAGRVASEATAAAPAASLDTQRPLRIEDVLGTVLAPLARQHAVLLLIIDGLSHAAALPFVDDLRTDGWQLQGPGGRALSGVLAALPTVTVVSRASLLSGRITTGGQDVERDGFTTSAPLLDVAAGQPPAVFHKRELRTQDGEIAPAAREAITDPGQRVVGVVVNAADDHLAKGDQLKLADGLDGIPVLRPLLDDAIQAGRVVVLTSDHGHILGSHQRVVGGATSGGERYRTDDGRDVADDEVRLEGARVVGGPIVAGADDGIRYNAIAKHGYHGGATPAEVLCPLLVLTSSGVELDGWVPLPPYAPAWWEPESAPVEIDLDDGAAATAVAAPAGPTRDEPQLSLLEPEPAPTASPASPAAPTSAGSAAWLAQLLSSPRLADQRRLAGRARLDDTDLATLLRVLVASGGTASGATLQRTLDLPATRLRGKLEAARSLLDVDGYQVLRIETDGTAALNVDLLVQQFEIDRPPTA